jgi:hypothetical protein
MDTITLIDQYVAVTPGEPYRLLPFGRIVKNGKVREITREFAALFRLPHFKPPIKLGSHKEETPAGGHIIGLELREDGLYAIPEYTTGGMATLTTGGFRYHSPEILWDGGYEDPQTGELIAGPLIVGDALLHTPHLGEATALYSIEPVGGTHMSENTVTVPAGLWDKFMAFMFPENSQRQPEPAPAPAQPEPVEAREDFAAQVENLTAEVEKLKAEKLQLEADRAHQSRVDAFAAELKETTLNEDVELFGVLAALDDEAAQAITRRMKALSEQAKAAKLTQDVGGSGEQATPADKFAAAIQLKIESGLGRAEAVAAIAKENPELIAAVRGGK